jgi:large subunit ribosomal protein L37Ae
MAIKYGVVKRFGARYGRRVKERFGQVESELRKKHMCPYCHKRGVKRIAAGIWECRKCSAEFTGAAYTPSKKVITDVFVKKSEEETGKSGA